MLYVIGSITLILGSLWYCGSTIYSTFAFILEKAPEGASPERISAIRALKWLAKNGILKSDSMIETEEGKTVQARKVKGLTFIGTAESEPAIETSLLPPNETNVTPSATEEPTV